MAVVLPCPAIQIDHPPELVRIGRARVPAGSSSSYTLESTWAIHLYYGEGDFSVCGHEFHLTPGSITVTPRGSTSHYRTEQALDHIFVHVSLSETPSGGVQLPCFVDHDQGAGGIAATLRRALVVGREETSWAEAHLWTALHELAAAGAGRGPSAVARQTLKDEHPALRSVLDFIELNLPNPIALQDLGRAAGLSATHVNRLFGEHIGMSAMRYVRERRMDLARYLLTRTSVPVKEIAYQVGIADIHAFNKLCKRYLGAAPTRLREGST